MRQALATTQNFSALRGKIEFTSNRRMNQYINLVQIRQNRFEKVQQKFQTRHVQCGDGHQLAN